MFNTLNEKQKEVLTLFAEPSVVLTENDIFVAGIRDFSETLRNFVKDGILSESSSTTSHIDGLREYALTEYGSKCLVKAKKDKR